MRNITYGLSTKAAGSSRTEGRLLKELQLMTELNSAGKGMETLARGRREEPSGSGRVRQPGDQGSNPGRACRPS